MDSAKAVRILVVVHLVVAVLAVIAVGIRLSSEPAGPATDGGDRTAADPFSGIPGPAGPPPGTRRPPPSIPIPDGGRSAPPGAPPADAGVGIRRTRRLVAELELAVELYRGRHGEYPPSALEGGNGIDEGIESLTARLESGGLLPESGRLGDPDGDGRAELLDAWGRPLVYYRHDRYGRTEPYRFGGETVLVTPRVSLETGEHHAREFVQIWSAGPDGANEDGGGDDVTSWHIRE